MRWYRSINIIVPGKICQVTDMASFFIGRPCKKGADDLLKLSRIQLKMVVAILTGLLLYEGTCILWACLMGIQTADSAGRRLKQCSILFAAARPWLVSAITSLGTRLSNQKIEVQPQ